MLVSSEPLKSLADPIRLVLSRYCLTDEVQRTDIKTTYRDFYDGERERVSALSGADEVLFLGEDDYLKAGSFTSFFLEREGQLLTPRGPGLLPGVLRAELLDMGRVIEADLTLDDLKSADVLYVGNSLRGLMRAEMIGFDPV